ncbi:peptide ABC transporter substrate-binding protein [Tritonibacter mobilis]|jgi:peptide/nickel transport system substrate-binding protein|uniref:peptide ABC transporter substrate-binding protein n=1 Tax=Tritonibacter mobilis TaxID=379347 RepID=UPI0001B8AE79|nr:peptide ABC transporter substrate-binding protein [Tritonibacter mobilis]EEW57082.1 extracellular solute-binding protein, family 5 [Ruegeria sp. TrichCH4B]NKX38096.1 peptide ABC transporter substrate-binding protein [Rhodobacteraceae bacterium R_SAG5]NKX75695.1 peptide ABC transporter substrate-binding protein [Rhodobacteraceae bacterium R_SAG3]PXW76498.1 peptide/nickel transport system substrate-binding protein [Ruegeria sp. P4]MCK5503490.1 peptide ABC transporter substrate-binding protein
MTLKTLLLGAVATAAVAPAAFAERGSDGQVNIIYWQAPSIMTPFLSGGTKDVEAASLVIEPLARFNASGEMVPWLVEEIPTVSNGGVSEDLTQITWKLKPGIKWSDGTDLTSADVKFTYEYCTHPEGGCAQVTKFEGVTGVETPDENTVVVTFDKATPYPYGPFVGGESPIIQAAQFGECLGAKAPECTEANFNPIGTGPFVVDEFKPNDVITLSANPNYRDPAKPAFAKVLLKGGGDATAAGRAVMETGEFDYAWNLQLAPDVIAQMEAGGKGKAVAGFGPLLERIMLNNTNPSADLSPEERSVIRPHPFLSDPAVYKALSMAIDRELLVEIGYGKAGRPSCSWVPAPEAFAINPEGCNVQDIAGANALLDQAGIVDTDGDGIREKDGVPLEILFQTSTNAVRQDFQALIKQWWSEIGVETELRNINGSVFFGGDPGSPDTFQKFYADVEMYANTFNGTDPQSYFGNGLCDKAPTPASQWQGENISRFCDEEYDALHEELSQTADAAKRIEIGQKLNTIVFEKGGMIPIVHRGRLSGVSNTLGGVDLNVWDSELWNAADWYRTE